MLSSLQVPVALCVALGMLPSVRAQTAAAKPAIANVQDCVPAAADYPADALRDNRQGTVRLRFTVAASGDLKTVVLRRSSGTASLDEAAARKLSTCKFVSAKASDGSPIESSFDLEYVWRIQ